MSKFAVVSEPLGKGFRRFSYRRGRREIVLDDPGEAFVFDRHDDAVEVSRMCNASMPGCEFRIYIVRGECR